MFLKTRPRFLTVWLGVLAIVATGIYPPWAHTYPSYGWLFVRPGSGAQIDIVRLLVEWIIISVVTGGFYFAPPRFTTRKRKTEWRQVWVRLRPDHRSRVEIGPTVESIKMGLESNWWIEMKDGKWCECESFQHAADWLEDSPQLFE